MHNIITIYTQKYKKQKLFYFIQFHYGIQTVPNI